MATTRCSAQPDGRARAAEEPTRAFASLADRTNDASPFASAFLTTEHFVLQSARSTTVAEASGRAAIYLATLSGGVVALAFVGQTSELGTAFVAFALILLPVMGFVGTVTFLRLVQTSIEDIAYAQRIGLVRAQYIRVAPEIRPYLVVVGSKAKALRLDGRGESPSSGQLMLTVAGMVGVLNSVVFGAAAAVALQVVGAQSVQARVLCGALVGASVLTAHALHHRRARDGQDVREIDVLAISAPVELFDCGPHGLPPEA